MLSFFEGKDLAPLPTLLMVGGAISFFAGFSLYRLQQVSQPVEPAKSTIATPAPAPVQNQQATVAPTITVSPTFNVNTGTPSTQHTQESQSAKALDAQSKITSTPPNVAPIPQRSIYQVNSGGGDNYVQGANGRIEVNHNNYYNAEGPSPTSVVVLETSQLVRPPMPIGGEPVKQGDRDSTWRQLYMIYQQQMSAVRAFRPGVSISFRVPTVFRTPSFIVTCETACVPYSLTVNFDNGLYRTWTYPPKDPLHEWRIETGLAKIEATETITVVVRSFNDEPIGNVAVRPYAANNN